MNAISTLTVLPTTKAELANFSGMVKDSILSGEIPAERSAILLKAMEEMIKTLRADPDIKEYIQTAADNHAEKSYSFDGAEIRKSERPTFNFKFCRCSRWDDLDNEIKQKKAEKEGIEKWLKSLKVDTPDPVTGEIIKPPLVKKTSIISIILAK